MLNIQGSTKEKIIIDFKNIKNSIRHFNNDKYFYEFILDGKWLNLILDKKITWEDFFLSLRFTLEIFLLSEFNEFSEFC